MDFIVFIHGNVKYTITIDPTVWIFDERKIDLNTWEGEEKRKEEEWEAYKKSVSEQFDKDITKGVEAPAKTRTNEARSKKEQLIHGTFGIPFGSFIGNAGPESSATRVMIETSGGDEYEVALEDAFHLVAGFSENGEPLKETGPIHLYYGDGSNKENPITYVTGLRVE
ncbi:peptidyl-prolyl cis-trans isomerase [Salibacterium lacus]|uniref:Peptidyl-prolyl cis-trans isomerase n=1 Tax=Salibacterium lacus TaxID=1898109 RepID=A0ABW5T0A1_9BACI